VYPEESSQIYKFLSPFILLNERRMPSVYSEEGEPGGLS
jgi:hypothetical protein